MQEGAPRRIQDAFGKSPASQALDVELLSYDELIFIDQPPG
jgi:hypothetical protein